MKTDAQRARDKKRFDLELLRRESNSYDDAVQRTARKDTKSFKGRKQRRARRDVDQFIKDREDRIKIMEQEAYNPAFSGSSATKKEMIKKCGGAVMKARGGTFKGVF